MTKNEKQISDKAYNQSKRYWNRRQTSLDKGFNKTSNEILKDLQAEYKRVWKDIELEITRKWNNYVNVDPNFKWSELHELEKTQKAIELLLDELFNIEKNNLTNAMDDIYVSTYQDMMELTKQYFDGLDKTVPDSITMIQETNRVASMSGLETVLRREIDTHYLSEKIWDKEILKQPLDWYNGFAGDRFENRIERRRAIVKHQINEAIRNAMVKGSSVDKATKDIMDRLNPHGLDDLSADVKKKLDASYKNAKRLAHNELTYAQHCADSRQMKENGFKGVKRKTVKDSHVCPICKEHEGEIIPIEQYQSHPNILMLHVNCRDYGVPVMSLDGDNPFRKFVEKYDKEQKKK